MQSDTKSFILHGVAWLFAFVGIYLLLKGSVETKAVPFGVGIVTIVAAYAISRYAKYVWAQRDPE